MSRVTASSFRQPLKQASTMSVNARSRTAATRRWQCRMMDRSSQNIDRLSDVIRMRSWVTLLGSIATNASASAFGSRRNGFIHQGRFAIDSLALRLTENKNAGDAAQRSGLVEISRTQFSHMTPSRLLGACDASPVKSGLASQAAHYVNTRLPFFEFVNNFI